MSAAEPGDFQAPPRLRADAALPKPIIDVHGQQEWDPVVRSAAGIAIEMARPEGAPANSTAIYYTMSAEESEAPSCGEQLEAGKWQTPPVGTEYEAPIHFCGEDLAVRIRAVLCPHGAEQLEQAGSEMEEKIIDVRRYEPPQPQQPVLQPVDAACNLGSAGLDAQEALTCSVSDASEEARVAVSVTDYVCSNPMYGTAEECGENGAVWGPMRLCSQDYASKPCMDVYFTKDGSDPVTSETRHLYEPSYGLSLRPGAWELRVVAVRSQRRYHQRNCKCCCQRSDCHLPGLVLARSVSVKVQEVQRERQALVGSPDIHMLVDRPYASFQEKFYQLSTRLHWRTGVAEALGLAVSQRDRQGDYRRILGECLCSQSSGCLQGSTQESVGSDICFRSGGAGGARTLVTFYISAAGLCVGGRNRGICMSNSSCGDGRVEVEGEAGSYCELKPSSWLLAYSRLQDNDPDTYAALQVLGIVNVTLSRQVDTSGIEEQETDLGSAALEAVTAILLVLVFVGVCCMARQWICWSCVPAAKSAGKQVVNKIQTSRAQARIGRHAQFKRMSDDADNVVCVYVHTHTHTRARATLPVRVCGSKMHTMLSPPPSFPTPPLIPQRPTSAPPPHMCLRMCVHVCAW